MDNNLVISSRIRLARNIKGIPFKEKMSAEDKEKVKSKIREAIKSFKNDKFDYLDMSNVSNIQAGSMVEEHLISVDFANNKEGAALLLSRSKNFSIMINEEDHLRIQALGKGLVLDELYKKTDELDDFLDESLNFSFSDALGYLTCCPSNLGTALRASVMVHLPALTKQGVMGNIINSVTQLGMTVRGLYGEGTKPGGNIYQISNQMTLGINEKDTIERLYDIVSQIIKQEKNIRERIFKDISVQDEIFRAYGILKEARVLSSAEFVSLTSMLRFGCEQGLIKIPIEDVDTLFNSVQPYSLMLSGGETLEIMQRDIRRAEIVRNTLNQKG